MANKSNLPMDINLSKQQLPAMAVLPMRFYAHWDVDRTSSPIAVQRVLSMVFTRLSFSKVVTENTPITIAIRLQNNKRTLRTNDLSILPSKMDIPLDISFIIQYCHFIKRKPNILQILIQRRKRYKNRQIPGFKTLAMGHLNLDEVLQFGGSRELVIWDTSCLQQKVRHSMRELHAGKIEITNCFTKAAETFESYGSSSAGQQRIVTTVSEKEHMVLSEEEPEDFSSGGEDSESDQDFTPRTATNDRDHAYIQRRQKKFLKQRNIKQKVIALLRKFKPDEAAVECPTSGSIVQPTELELQEIFEELENISGDSGPEIEDDKMSIVSNPRPKIRPFFGSKADIMLPIMDLQNELFLSDEMSADSEVASSAEERQKDGDESQQLQLQTTRKESTQLHQQLLLRSLLKHSDTANSIMSSNEQPSKIKGNEPIEEMFSKLCSFSSSSHIIIPEHIWICSSADLPWISKVNAKLLEPICLIDCPSSVTVRTLLQAIIARIQNFCNNNSVSPPTTIIGVLGGDHLLANILKAYVVLLQDKACKEDWLNYLRFSLVLPSYTAVGRLLSQVAGFGGYAEAIWKSLSQVSHAFKADTANGGAGTVEHNEIRDCLSGITKEQERAQRYTNLHIGEVMLQLSNIDSTAIKMAETEGRSQEFVPFLAELLTGSGINSSSEHASTSSPSDPSYSSLHYIGITAGDEQQQRQTESAVPPSHPAIQSPGGIAISAAVCKVSVQPSTQHSQSFPAIPNLFELSREKEVAQEELLDVVDKNSQLQKTFATSSPLSAACDGRELQIEYWTCLNYPCSSSSFASGQNQQLQPDVPSATTNVGSKFSMKASVRTLSIAREPMSNLLSILFVKERKKDKMLHKLGRRSKQKSVDASGIGFSSQSRVVSGVTRIVCTSGGAGGMGGKKEAERAPTMEVSIDGVAWRGVRFFQISAQWQTHVKLFPVSFPAELPVNINK